MLYAHPSHYDLNKIDENDKFIAFSSPRQGAVLKVAYTHGLEKGQDLENGWTMVYYETGEVDANVYFDSNMGWMIVMKVQRWNAER